MNYETKAVFIKPEIQIINIESNADIITTSYFMAPYISYDDEAPEPS